jgi:hypothetical protein
VVTRQGAKEETMDTSRPAGWVELAKRAADGLEVVLLWDRSRNRVKVAVSDERLCHHLDLEVTAAEALGAFYQPFAHATARLADGARGAEVASPPIPKGARR